MPPQLIPLVIHVIPYNLNPVIYDLLGIFIFDYEYHTRCLYLKLPPKTLICRRFGSSALFHEILCKNQGIIKFTIADFQRVKSRSRRRSRI